MRLMKRVAIAMCVSVLVAVAAWQRKDAGPGYVVLDTNFELLRHIRLVQYRSADDEANATEWTKSIDAHYDIGAELKAELLEVGNDTETLAVQIRKAVNRAIAAAVANGKIKRMPNGDYVRDYELAQ